MPGFGQTGCAAVLSHSVCCPPDWSRLPSVVQEEAFDIADQVVVFNRGVVEQSGTPEELQTAPQTPFVMQFVSDTNTLPTHHAVSVQHGLLGW